METTLAVPRKAESQRRGRICIALDVEARNPDGRLVGFVHDDYDLATKQLGQMIQALILASTQTISDTGGSGRSIAAGSTSSAPTVMAGTGSTAATVVDTALVTQTETQAGTVNAWSGSGSSGTFTVTATVTAGADRAYAEVGLKMTNGAHDFMVCRDVFSTLNVSSSGTLAVTYTLSFS